METTAPRDRYPDREHYKKQLGSVPEWPMGAGCKPAGLAYGGSNPSRPTNQMSETLALILGG